MAAKTRAAAIRAVDRVLADLTAELEAARDETDPEARAAALGRTVAYVLPLRVAVSDARAQAVVQSLDRGASVRGLAMRLGLSRGMVQQLQHRGRNGSAGESGPADAS